MKKLIILAIAVLIPASASAATVYLESSRSELSVGDTAIVAVKINAEGAIINTVEGDVTLASETGKLAVQEFSLANSQFGLWPRTPSLSPDGNTVSFVGGVPGGFSIEGATLFKMVIEARQVGMITISPQNIAAYANDGSGTKLPVQTKGLAITVNAKDAGAPVRDDWAGVVAQDTTPPEDFIIVLGQDNGLFSGNKFAFFSAVDNQSGIDHYEVSENGAPAVRSGSTYVLLDQDEDVTLDVTAFDKAGNKKKASLSPESGMSPWLWAAIAVFAALAAMILMRMRGRNKRNVPTGI